MYLLLILLRLLNDGYRISSVFIGNFIFQEKKKELQLEFEEMERKMRRKSVGNCRFIGELFKLEMLTAKIMIRCVAQLLSNLEEESLECLCKLLTTIGKDLEVKLVSVHTLKAEKLGCNLLTSYLYFWIGTERTYRT